MLTDTMTGRGASGPQWWTLCRIRFVSGARPGPCVWRIAIDHTRGGERRRREEAESPPRRLGGSPKALSPERSAHPDGAGARFKPEEIRGTRPPSAGALEASPA